MDISHSSGYLEGSELLKTQSIHYLSPDVLRSYSDLSIRSEEGSLFRVNALVLLSKSYYLRRLLDVQSDEDRIILTDIPAKDLEVVLESLIEGERLFPPEDIKGIVSALEALGLQSTHFGPSFFYNNVTLKMEMEDLEDDIETHLEQQMASDGEESIPSEDFFIDDESHPEELDESLPTSCTICTESFLKQSALDKHAWTHFPTDEKKEKIHCSSCQKHFPNYESIKLHALLVHGGMDLKSPPGHAASTNKKIKKPNLTPSLQCVNCGQFNAVDPGRFLDIHASSNPYHTPECNYPTCNESFKSYSEHMAHVRTAHDGKLHIKCGRCGELFLDLPSLMAHRKEVHHAAALERRNAKIDRAALTKKEKCVCELCGMSLSRGNMRTHLKVVHGNDPVDCSICKKTFNHPMSLKLHSDSAHREFPCGQCGYMCRSPKAYKLHILSKHTLPEQKPFQCSFCSKGFTTAYKFKQHENIHRGIKPHVCKFCGKGFCNSSNRNQHEKSIHLGDKRVKPKAKLSPDENS